MLVLPRESIKQAIEPFGLLRGNSKAPIASDTATGAQIRTGDGKRLTVNRHGKDHTQRASIWVEVDRRRELSTIRSDLRDDTVPEPLQHLAVLRRSGLGMCMRSYRDDPISGHLSRVGLEGVPVP